ncbi:MAG: Type secretion system protein virB9 precursor, partial [Pseudomonadota bacterium]
MNKYKLLFFILYICAQFCCLNTAYAIRESKPTAIDSRIRIMVYNPDDVFKYVGYYGYQASIELSQGEAVETISMGDTVAWQVVPSGNRIFI